MAKSKRQDREPPYPKPPEIDRRIGLPLSRLLGYLGIAIVPVLAIGGAFGDTADRISVRGPNVSAWVEFPTRFRYEMLNYVTVSVTNTSREPIDTIRVRFDSSYVLRFSGVVFYPSEEQAFVVPVTDVAPGDTRLVRVEIQGNRYGRHTGQLHIESTSGDTLTASLHSLVFP